MATRLKAVPAIHSPLALALVTLDALRGDLLSLVMPDVAAADLRLASFNDEPAIAVKLTLKPFTDATRTTLKLESGMLAGYRVEQVQTTLESTSSSRRVVTAFVLPEIAHG